jgi:uncharacterized protein YsxB (DUF464 family)
MIKITYCTRDRPGRPHPSITVDGHANYAEHGRDIVCASVSVLFQSLANALETYTADDIAVRISPGDSHIIWNGHQSTYARLITGAFVDGMRAVAEEYPDYVQLNIE